MGPRRAPPRKASSSNSKEGKKKPEKKPNQARTDGQRQQQRLEGEEIDLSTPISVSLQQLLLNVFKGGLLAGSSRSSGDEPHIPSGQEREEEELDIKTLIQTIKSHLYNRDFESAFADANEDLLRAYALRWSASRALGYVGVLRGVVGSRFLPFRGVDEKDGEVKVRRRRNDGHVLCIGGGAGAEIVALAGAWRDLMDEERARMKMEVDGGDDDAKSVSGAVREMTLEEETSTLPNISITAVDIADWSSVVERLSTAMKSPTLPSSKAHPAPLLPPDDDDQDSGGRFSVSFQKSDVLNLSDDELRDLLHLQSEPKTSTETPTKTVLVTLMFTLNELFSTSMSKTTSFLLRMTDLLEPDTVLLVVDSPGSYSTVTLKSKSPETPSQENPSQRNYPMKFLLDHTLLSVAAGKWDKILSQDSRWFRRDATKLRYAVGEGAGLEDMRFQIHVYRRLEG